MSMYEQLRDVCECNVQSDPLTRVRSVCVALFSAAAKAAAKA